MRLYSVLIGTILIFINFHLSGQETKNWQIYPASMTILDASVAEGKLWLGTDNGLYELNESGSIVNKYDKLNGDLPSNHVRAAAAANGGGSWVGTYAAGIRKVEDSNVMDLPELNEAVEDTFLHAIEKIKGTDKIGILTEVSYHVYDGEEVQTHDLPGAPFSGSWDEVYFKPESDSTFWVSTAHHFKHFNGQNYEDQRENKFRLYGPKTALAYDQQNRLWATHGNELTYRENGQWNWIDAEQIGLNSPIRCMNRGTNGELYVASEDRIVTRQNGQWQKWKDLDEGFWEDKAEWLIEAQNDKLYFPGESGQKLIGFDGEHTASQALLDPAFHHPSRLSTAGDKIWLKAYRGPHTVFPRQRPYTIFQIEGEEWRELNVPERFQSRIHGGMTAISDREFWIKGDSALFRYKEGHWQAFNSQNSNLASLSFRGSLKAIDGELWVATRQGLQKFEEGKFVYPEGAEQAFQDLHVSQFLVNENAIWLFDWDEYRLKKWENGNLTKLSGEWHKGELGNATPQFIKRGPENGVWIGSSAGNLACYKNNRWQFPQALNDALTYGSFTRFATIDSSTFALSSARGIVLSHSDSLQWIQQSNSPLPYNRISNLVVTEDRKVALITGYRNYVSVFDLTEPEHQSSTNNAEKPNKSGAIERYPNPVKDQLQVEVPSYSGNAVTYRLYNGKGQMVRQGTLQTTGKQTIEVKGLDQGLYFLNVQAGSINETRKILKR